MSVGKNKGTTRKTTAGKPVDKDKLSQAFQVVREQFFPKWDRAKRWRVRQVDYLDESQGKCCRDRKEIQILNFPDGEERNLLLIHEIAHAFDLGHEERWQARIKSALDTAEQLGRTELAGLLREELAQYKNPAGRESPETIYQAITEAVEEMGEDQSWPFSHVVEHLALTTVCLQRSS